MNQPEETNVNTAPARYHHNQWRMTDLFNTVTGEILSRLTATTLAPTVTRSAGTLRVEIVSIRRERESRLSVATASSERVENVQNRQ